MSENRSEDAAKEGPGNMERKVVCMGCIKVLKEFQCIINRINRFPKDPYLREEWISFCGRFDTWYPKKTTVICSDHFEPSCFQPQHNQKRRLVDGAKPTIYNGPYKLITTDQGKRNETKDTDAAGSSLRKTHNETKDTDAAGLSLVKTHSETKDTDAAGSPFENQSVVITLTPLDSIKQEYEEEEENVSETDDTDADLPAVATAAVPSENQFETRVTHLQNGTNATVKAEREFAFANDPLASAAERGEIDPQSRRTYTLYELIARNRKLLTKVKCQSIKIKRLHSKIRYLEKKVTTLSDILNID